jgi:hypothetical protein
VTNEHNLIYTTYSENYFGNLTWMAGDITLQQIVTKCFIHIVGNLTLTPAVLVATASKNKHKVAWQGIIYYDQSGIRLISQDHVGAMAYLICCLSSCG